jgi:hypothetical protein
MENTTATDSTIWHRFLRSQNAERRKSTLAGS